MFKTKKEKKKPETFKEKVIDNIKVFFSAYAIAFVIRLFIIEAYMIPSQSMVPSLNIPDIMMIEKVTMGSRIPIINQKIPGFLSPQRNDIITFVSPAWKKQGFAREIISLLTLSLINLDNTFDNPKNLVKRLIGLPGDTISMSNQILIINRKPVDTEYVTTAREAVYERSAIQGYMDFDMFNEKYDGKNRIVQHLIRLNRVNAPEVYNFDEIYIPKKGDVIPLTNRNYYYTGLLKLLVERESGKSATLENGKIYLDGKEIDEWKVNDNYYFGMGDNRDLSEDCRYFGFIPGKNIFGRPLFRYYPFNRMGVNLNDDVNSVRRKIFY